MQLENARNEAHFAQENNKDHIDEQKEKKSLEYEVKIKEIKEATGVSAINDVLSKIEGQQSTREHLEKLKDENEQRLKEMKTALREIQSTFEEIKYSSSHAKHNHNEAMAEEVKQHLIEAQQKMQKDHVKYEKTTKLLSDIEIGIRHLNLKIDGCPLVILGYFIIYKAN